jgi:hypothetical protein
MNFILLDSTPSETTAKIGALLRAERVMRRQAAQRPPEVVRPTKSEAPQSAEASAGSQPKSAAAVKPTIPETAKTPDNRRFNVRKALKVAGNIGIDAHHQLGCTVLDMSGSGVMLRLDAPPANRRQAPPDRFYLVIDNILERWVADCSVCWRDGDRLGVKFMAPIEVTVKKRAARPMHKAASGRR